MGPFLSAAHVQQSFVVLDLLLIHVSGGAPTRSAITDKNLINAALVYVATSVTGTENTFENH